MAKFTLEIEVHRDAEPDAGPWFSWGYIISEGDSLEDLISNATIDKINQDGGNFGERPADAPWMEELVIEAYNEKYGEKSTDLPLQSNPARKGWNMEDVG